MKYIGIAVLAAGSSTRFNGEPKQLLKFKVVTLLRRAAETALASGFSTLVVLGKHHEIFRKEIDDLPLKIAINENWKSGIASSIKTALAAFAEENADAVIFMLCDQPFVSSEILRQLADVSVETKKPIVASRYADTIGVPALFAREIFDELEDLRNDQGAKKIIVKDLNRTAFVDAPEAAFDVDTLQDLEKIEQRITRNH